MDGEGLGSKKAEIDGAEHRAMLCCPTRQAAFPQVFVGLFDW